MKELNLYIACKASEVYTDGACKRNGKPDALAGYGVWWGDDHVLCTVFCLINSFFGIFNFY